MPSREKCYSPFTTHSHLHDTIVNVKEAKTVMKTRILLVDDDPNIRQLVNLYLVKEGFDVVMAEQGNEALKVFADASPDLILLDLMLPGMDGW